MKLEVFKPLQNGQLDFTLQFENAIFAIAPASCALLAVILASASLQPWLGRRRGQYSTTTATVQDRV